MNKIVTGIAAFAFILFLSCSKHKTVQQPDTATLTAILNSGGPWTLGNLVKEFDIEPGKNLKGTTLFFYSDGKMKVQLDTLSSSGKWSVYGHDEDLIFSMAIDDEYFLYLSSHWSVIAMSSTRLDLEFGKKFRTYMMLERH